MICRSKKVRVVAVIVALVGFAFIIVVLRTRGFLVAWATPPILLYLYGRVPQLRRMVLVVVLVGVLAALVVGVRVLRHMGGAAALVENWKQVDLVQAAIGEVHAGELALYSYYSRFMETWPSLPGFGSGWTVRRILLMPVPGSWTPLKPPDFTHQMWVAAKGSSELGQSMHPTILGAAYADLGWYSLLVFPLLIAVFWTGAEAIVSRSRALNLLTVGLFGLSGFAVARGSVYNGFAFLIGGVLVLGTAMLCQLVVWRLVTDGLQLGSQTIKLQPRASRKCDLN